MGCFSMGMYVHSTAGYKPAGAGKDGRENPPTTCTEIALIYPEVTFIGISRVTGITGIQKDQFTITAIIPAIFTNQQPY